MGTRAPVVAAAAATPNSAPVSAAGGVAGSVSSPVSRETALVCGLAPPFLGVPDTGARDVVPATGAGLDGGATIEVEGERDERGLKGVCAG